MKKFKYTIDGQTYEVEVEETGDCSASVTVNGETFNVGLEKPEKKEPHHVAPAKAAPAAEAEAPAAKTAPAGAYTVQAPLPGVITEVCVAEGDDVKAGDTVVVLEAMKMANNLETERDGRVTHILVKPGQSVMEGDPLVAIG